jgi:hypothetical protein
VLFDPHEPARFPAPKLVIAQDALACSLRLDFSRANEALDAFAPRGPRACVRSLGSCGGALDSMRVTNLATHSGVGGTLCAENPSVSRSDDRCAVSFTLHLTARAGARLFRMSYFGGTHSVRRRTPARRRTLDFQPMHHALQFILRTASIVGALTASLETARANLIVNGSFEQDPSAVVASGPYGDYGAWIRLAPGTAYLTGWTVGGFGGGGVQGVDWHLGTSSYSPRPAKDGLRMIDLNIDGTGGQGSGQGTISQGFATQVGASYTLSFWLAGPSSGAQGGTLDPRSVHVDITGSATQTFSVVASDPSNQVWYQQVFTFEASTAWTTLTFSPLEGTQTSGFWGPFIDDVQVQLVPAPGALALLGLGVLCPAIRRRSRRA